MAPLDLLRTAVARVDARLAPLRATLPWRAYTRYGLVRGNVLAGGIAYFAFFSVFPALAIGFTAFAVVLGSQEDLQVQVVQFVNSNLGATVVGYHAGQGLVSISQLARPELVTTTGLVGLVVLVLSGLGWIAALRDGVQAVFATRDETNFVVVKLLDLVLLAAAGMAVLASVVAGLGVDVATGRVVEALGLERSSLAGWSVNLASQLFLLLVDAVVFTLLFHRLAGTPVPWRDLAVGGTVGAAGFGVLKLFAGELLRAAAQNRFLAASGILVGLLVWMNLVARLTLVAAALSATLAADRGHLPDNTALTAVAAARGAQVPGPLPAVADAATARTAADPAAARRAGRLLLGVGFVLGAAAGWLVTRRGRRRPGP